MSEGDRYESGSAKLYKDWGETLVIVLPHQCQRWTIGTKDDVCKLITDLHMLMSEMDD